VFCEPGKAEPMDAIQNMARGLQELAAIRETRPCR